MEKTFEAGGEPLDREALLAAVAAAGLGAWTSDAQGRLTHVGPEFLNLIGRSLEEVLGDGWIQWLSPEVRNLQEQTWRAAIATKEPFERLHSYLTAQGERHTVVVRANPVREGRGPVRGWAGLYLEAPPEPAKAPRSPIDTFLESTTDAFVAFDPELRFTYVNRVASEMIQRKPEEILGLTQTQVFPQLQGTKVEAEYRRAMRDQTPVHFEFHVPQADTWLELHIYPSETGLAVYFRDISERKRAEGRLAIALQGAQASVWEWDLTTDLMTWSREMYEITGIPLDVAPSRTVFFDRIESADQARIYMATVRAVDESSELDEEVQLRSISGEPRWLSIRGTVIRDAEGKAIRMVGLAQNITERRQAEEELKSARRSLSLALLGGRMGYWSRRLEPDIVTWSPELEALFGLEPGAFSGERGRGEFLRLVHPDDQGLVEQTVREALESGEDYRMEFRFRHADGSWRWMEGRGRASYDAAGTPTWIHGVGIDITENKEIEARYERLANLVPCLVWVLDGRGHTRWVNRRWKEVTGLTSPQPTSEDWLALIHPDDLEPSRKIWWECLRNGTPYESELRYRTTGGEYRWFLERGEPVTGGDGEVVEWFGTSVDIHDRKLEEARIQLLLDSMPLIAWSSKGDGAVDYINRHYMEYCGMGQEARGEVGWDKVVHPDDRPAASAEFRRCFEAGTIWEQELRLRRHDGEYRWHLSRLVPLGGEDGAIYRWFGTSTDIHDQKVKEQTLATLNQELEARVEERTAELVEANREMEGFTYTVSHDLRAPLRAIMSTSMILLEEAGEKLATEERALLERQAHNAKHLGVLIDELLKLSRISRQDMKFVRFDLSALAAEVATELGDALGAKVELEIEPGLSATGDPKLVRFVLLNLMENAGKFSPDGGTVRVGKRDGAFFVQDEGIGFDPRYQDKLFRPFERLVSQSEYPGTGIGLANVKRIVERHGGRVWAESSPGKGSTFWFTLGGASRSNRQPKTGG